ncbi:cutinase family protein [Candidatus Saccharibacteria bacterium]|nr:cutinase family protein [Candidatus Saccharibacteria bacterium]
MKKCLLIITTILTALGAIPPPLVSAASCPDYEAIFARGSGEPLSSNSYQSFQTHLSQTFSESGLQKSLSFYELGSSPQSGHQYPAIDMADFTKLLGAKISGGNSYSYGDSVKEGVSELKAFISNFSHTCPSTRFILAGYSQGAQVLTIAKTSLPADKITYLATFGDPKLYLPEGISHDGQRPPACANPSKLSSYRINVPDCTVIEGILGGVNPYQPSTYQGKLGTWCNLHDFMCGSTFDFSNLMAAHIAYSTDDSYRHAAQVILNAAKKESSTSSETSTTPASTSTSRDAAIIIDSTGSMSDHIERYKTHASNLARTILSGGGRVALYEYRDLSENYQPQKLCDFGCNLEEFQSKLDMIDVDGGGDTPESTISAAYTALNGLSWAKGATKTLLILTDAPAHNPDHDGVTREQLIRRAWEIDPVHISIITNLSDASTIESYQEIASKTGGKLYSLSDEDMELSTSDSLGLTPEVLTIPYQYDEITTPTLSIKSAISQESTIKISLEKSTDTFAVLVSLDDTILGLTTEATIEITDLTAPTTITLTPISNSGFKGTPVNFQFSPHHITLRAPNTGVGIAPYLLEERCQCSPYSHL